MKRLWNMLHHRFTTTCVLDVGWCCVVLPYLLSLPTDTCQTTCVRTIQSNLSRQTWIFLKNPCQICLKNPIFHKTNYLQLSGSFKVYQFVSISSLQLLQVFVFFFFDWKFLFAWGSWWKSNQWYSLPLAFVRWESWARDHKGRHIPREGAGKPDADSCFISLRIS